MLEPCSTTPACMGWQQCMKRAGEQPSKWCCLPFKDKWGARLESKLSPTRRWPPPVPRPWLLAACVTPLQEGRSHQAIKLLIRQRHEGDNPPMNFCACCCTSEATHRAEAPGVGAERCGHSTVSLPSCQTRHSKRCSTLVAASPTAHASAELRAGSGPESVLLSAALENASDGRAMHQ